MDDLNEKLASLLSSPEGMAKIQGLMTALTGGEGVPSLGASVSGSPAVPPPSPPPPPEPAMPSSGLPDLAALTKFLPLLSGAGQDNPDTRLLLALRPYLHGERERRLEETMNLLKLMRLLPVLQEQGILGGMKRDG